MRPHSRSQMQAHAARSQAPTPSWRARVRVHVRARACTRAHAHAHARARTNCDCYGDKHTRTADAPGGMQGNDPDSDSVSAAQSGALDPGESQRQTVPTPDHLILDPTGGPSLA
jgi:hypothetical protein